jgi:hypothetical protein
MKIETAVIGTKGLCFTLIGMLTPLTVGLAQWANTGEWPSPIIWIITGASCGVGGATQLLAFLSQSFGDYKAQLRTDAGVPAAVVPPFIPPAPAVEKSLIARTLSED